MLGHRYLATRFRLGSKIGMDALWLRTFVPR